MGISYAPLFATLHRNNKKLIDIKEKYKWSPNTIAKFRKNEYVHLRMLEILCEELKCSFDDIIEYIKE